MSEEEVTVADGLVREEEEEVRWLRRGFLGERGRAQRFGPL